MSEQAEGSQGPSGEGPPSSPSGSAFSRVSTHMTANKIEAGLWLTRMFTVGCVFNYFIPIFGGSPAGSFQRALISNAATSALRLHQRLPRFQLNREFFGMLMMEDSAHYLFYSLIFVGTNPATMFLFALLHATNYTKQLLDQVGPNSLQFLRGLVLKVETQQRNILRFIASVEIFLMVVSLLMIFSGQASLFLPFMYYRFLSMRYASRRNPYSRQLFYELRISVEHLKMKPACPGALRGIVDKIISFICRLAPQVPT